MEIFNITHPQAAEAIRLANAARFVSRKVITNRLAATGTPRGLYRLARQLAAAGEIK